MNVKKYTALWSFFHILMKKQIYLYQRTKQSYSYKHVFKRGRYEKEIFREQSVCR